MLEFTISYSKNEGLVLSPLELKELFLFGINFTDPNTGYQIPTDTFKFAIQAAQEETEKYLGIKLKKQIIAEDKDFISDDWKAWGYIKTTYPVVAAHALEGFINTVRQIQYPTEWISVRHTNDGEMYYRQIHLVPSGSTSGVTYSVVYNGIVPHLGFMGNRIIPNYWHMVYTTGFDTIPANLINFIGKLAAINLLYIAGELILGLGLSNKTISIDGLSQSFSSTKSSQGGAFSGQIQATLKDLQLMLPKLEGYYKGITFGVC